MKTGVLQSVTSLLLLHYSRNSVVGRSSSIHLRGQKIGLFGLPVAIEGVLLIYLFTVTTVTTTIIKQLKPAISKGNSVVTVNSKSRQAVTLLLQTVTNCYNNCYNNCYKINNCKSIIYKSCNSWHHKNQHLRIFHSFNQKFQ